MRRAAGLAAHYLRHRFRPHHPFEVQAVLLNQCNLRCSYCRCPEMIVPQMSTEDWCEIFEKLVAVGTLRIKFQGGEPTLRADFRTLSEAARTAGLVTAVVTNGSAIAARPSLLDSLDEVVVSLDAFKPEQHDRFRGAGSHAAALTALRHARQRGVRAYVNMVVHRETLAELEPMLELCEENGFGLNAQAVMFGHDYQDSNAEGLRLPQEVESKMHRKLAEWRRAGRPIMFSAGSYERTARWPDYRTSTVRSDGPSSCMAGRFYIHIEPNGDVHPCGMHVGRFEPANILRDGFEAALDRARVHDCGDCSLAYLNERKATFALRPSALVQILRRG